MADYRVSIKACEGEQRYNEPYETTVAAATATEARVRALRRFYENGRICAFVPYNALRGQDPSGQAGYGYEKAPRGSGALLSCATHRLRVTMAPV
jgi:hypothetical protein